MSFDPNLTSQLTILLSVTAALLIAMTVFFFRADSFKSRLLLLPSFGTGAAMGVGLLVTSWSYFAENSEPITAAVICSPEVPFAPSEVLCTNLTEGFDEAQWFIDGEFFGDGSRAITLTVDEPGVYVVTLRVSTFSTFRPQSAEASATFEISAREEYERSVNQSIVVSFAEAGRRTHFVSPPPGFLVDLSTVRVELTKQSGDLRIVDSQMSENGVEVQLVGQGEIGFSGLTLKQRPATGVLNVSFLARRSQVPD